MIKAEIYGEPFASVFCYNACDVQISRAGHCDVLNFNWFSNFDICSGSHLVCSLVASYPEWRIINLDIVSLQEYIHRDCPTFVTTTKCALMGFLWQKTTPRFDQFLPIFICNTTEVNIGWRNIWEQYFKYHIQDFTWLERMGRRNNHKCQGLYPLLQHLSACQRYLKKWSKSKWGG